MAAFRSRRSFKYCGSPALPVSLETPAALSLACWSYRLAHGVWPDRVVWAWETFDQAKMHAEVVLSREARTGSAKMELMVMGEALELSPEHATREHWMHSGDRVFVVRVKE